MCSAVTSGIVSRCDGDLVASANVASADPITVDVAEFRWNVFGDTVNLLVPTSDDCLSQFTLTYLWNGLAAQPVVSGELALDGSFFGFFFDLDSSFPVDQFDAGACRQRRKPRSRSCSC